MEWKEYTKESKPLEEGKYIVETETSMGSTHRLESTWTGKSWNCTNQIVKRYLDGSRR